MLLNETFSYKIGNIKTRNGNIQRVAYIDTKSSQDTYYIRNDIKKFGAQWEPNGKWWYWNLGNNPEEVIRKQVQPCIEYLSQIEDMGGDPKRNVIATVEKLISKVKGSSMPDVKIGSSKDDILARLEGYKQELIKITSDSEFKSMMEPIIKFRNANGYQYSMLNTILILIQDPKATMVKTRKNWEAMNRRVMKNAKPIMLWFPKGERTYNEDEKKQLTDNFLRKRKVKSIDELTPGDKEKLRVKLNSTTAESFDLGPYWFDYRFTEQIPNTEDIVGNPGHDIKWFDDDGDETPELVSKVDALLSVIEEQGISVNYVDDLNGARGVSKSGIIEVLKNQPKNVGMLNTLTHEFAHEILHQNYLKDKNPEMKDYFVGTEEGRGKVEQQAELCAWIVLRGFGYDMKTNINYVGIWGLNQDNAVKVFDSVSKVATFITKKINMAENGQNDMFESKQYIKENTIPSGYEIAKMVGCGNVYKKAALKLKQNGNVIKLNQDDLNEMIKSSIRNVLKEEYVDIFDENYYELIPLFNVFTEGYTFGSERDFLLTDKLYDKNGNELNYVLKDLCFKFYPNKK